MANPRRGEVWLVDLGDPIGHEQAGHRPAVIISNDLQNSGPSGVAVIVPVTTTRRPIPSHIELDPADSGLDEISYATCEHMRSISIGRLIHRLGAIGADRMFHVGRSIRILLDL